MSLLDAQNLVSVLCFALGFAGGMAPVILGIFHWNHAAFGRRKRTRCVPVVAFFQKDRHSSYPVVDIGDGKRFRPVVIPDARRWSVQPGELLTVRFAENNPTELTVEPDEKSRHFFAALQILCGVAIAAACLIRLIGYL